MTSVTLPEGLITIGYYTFYGCSSLNTITVPSTVTAIGQNAFANIGTITLVCLATTPPTLENTDAFTSTSGNIYVPDTSVDAYKEATNWSTYASRIKGLSELSQ